MKNVRVEFPRSTAIDWKNNVARNGLTTTGNVAGAITAGMLLVAGTLFAVAANDIAVNGEGVVETQGRFALAKATGTALTRGQLVGYDWANDRVTTVLNGAGGVVGTVAEDAVSTATVVYVNINQGQARVWTLEIDPTTTDETNEYVDIDIGYDNTKVVPGGGWFWTDVDGTVGVPPKIFRRTGAGNTTTWRVSLTNVQAGTRLYANFRQIAS